MHQANAFLTLTYSDDHLPEDYSVHVRTHQLFMKRLRKEIKTPLRFYACGEYGDENLRPHYHSLIFGYDFRSDRKLYKRDRDGNQLYTSEQLSKIWPYGLATLGSVTYKSAAYVARYCMKKIAGDLASTHYLRTHPKTNLVVQVEPEFQVGSRRPGLGSTWFDKFKDDCFPSDFLVVDGKQTAVPRYYLQKLEEEAQKKIKRQRSWRAAPHKWNKTSERLRVRGFIKSQSIQQLKRTLK